MNYEYPWAVFLNDRCLKKKKKETLPCVAIDILHELS